MLEFGRQRREQLGSNVRTQDAQRVRLEGHHHSVTAEAARPLRHVAYHLLVRAMHPVEVSHTHYRGTEIGRHVIEMAKNSHSFPRECLECSSAGWCQPTLPAYRVCLCRQGEGQRINM